MCVWLKVHERARLVEIAKQSRMSVSAIARRLLIHALDNASVDEILSIDGLVRHREHIYSEGTTDRIRRMQISHERRARCLGIQWEIVDLRLVYDHAKGICGICREPVSIEAFSVDHIIPVSHGGPHIFSNLQPSHLVCNIRKGPRRKPRQSSRS